MSFLYFLDNIFIYNDLDYIENKPYYNKQENMVIYGFGLNFMLYALISSIIKDEIK